MTKHPTKRSASLLGVSFSKPPLDKRRGERRAQAVRAGAQGHSAKAPAKAPSLTDPIFAAIDRHRLANEAYEEALIRSAEIRDAIDQLLPRQAHDKVSLWQAAENALERSVAIEAATLVDLISTRPTTLEGAAALAQHALGYVAPWAANRDVPLLNAAMRGLAASGIGEAKEAPYREPEAAQ